MSKEIEKIFEGDEMELLDVKSHWKPEKLLSMEGVFFLKDIINILEIDSIKLKNKVKEINRQGENPWEIMGTQKIWNHWIIRMKIFSPFYKNHLIPRIKKIPTNIDGNALLKQTGLFYLTEVCRFIPFSAHQIRYQAKRCRDSQAEMGVWKDEQLNCFVVDMRVFHPWIQNLWKGGYRKK